MIVDQNINSNSALRKSLESYPSDGWSIELGIATSSLFEYSIVEETCIGMEIMQSR